MTKKQTPVLAALDAAVVADYDAEISALKGQTQQLLEDLGKLTAERNNLKSLVQQSHKVVEEYKRGYVQTPLSFGRGRQSLPGARVGQSLSLSQIPTAHRMPSSIPTGIGQGEEATAEEGHPPGETDKATPAEHQESSAGGLRLEPHLAKQEGDPEPSRHLLRNGCTC